MLPESIELRIMFYVGIAMCIVFAVIEVWG